MLDKASRENVQMDSESTSADQAQHGILHDVGIFARGLGMGSADVVPGVSGGTVALVTGIYTRLITCISRMDATFIKYVTARKFSEAAVHIDLRFLLALAMGIGCGFIVTVKLLTGALESDDIRPLVFAAFNGMILAAAWIVIGMVRRLGHQNVPLNLVAGVIGIGIAATISQMTPTAAGESPELWYLFVCGAFGICAMILPGISGALILILLGVYQYLVAVAKEILHFENLGPNLLISVCFGAGCGVGLLTFSRVLRRLLDQRPGPTLSLLSGLMLGSLPLLWPFQVNVTPDVEDFKLRSYEAVMPALDSKVFSCIFVALAALSIVVFVEYLARKRSTAAS